MVRGVGSAPVPLGKRFTRSTILPAPSILYSRDNGYRGKRPSQSSDRYTQQTSIYLFFPQCLSTHRVNSHAHEHLALLALAHAMYYLQQMVACGWVLNIFPEDAAGLANEEQNRCGRAVPRSNSDGGRRSNRPQRLMEMFFVKVPEESFGVTPFHL
ncbi:hypothetical protein BC826DRAFT_1048575 [Russula brevipes]|nr:hypothetical protein BC826DRAFT_1048575 [Russula brevipes]